MILNHILIILADTSDANGFAVGGIVIGVLGAVLYFLSARAVNRADKRMDELEQRCSDIEELINKNVETRERQMSEIRKEMYESTLKSYEKVSNIDTRLAELKATILKK